MKFFLSLASLVLLAPVVLAASGEPRLDLVVRGSTQTLTASSLGKQIAPRTLHVYNPVYKRSMVYEGFWLEDVLKAAHVDVKDGDIVIQCSDGYGASLGAAELGRHEWLLAYQEKGGTWTPFPKHQPPANPAPWYLVNRSPDSFKSTPWPYGVIRLKIGKLW